MNVQIQRNQGRLDFLDLLQNPTKYFGFLYNNTTNDIIFRSFNSSFTTQTRNFLRFYHTSNTNFGIEFLSNTFFNEDLTIRNLYRFTATNFSINNINIFDNQGRLTPPLMLPKPLNEILYRTENNQSIPISLGVWNLNTNAIGNLINLFSVSGQRLVFRNAFFKNIRIYPNFLAEDDNRDSLTIPRNNTNNAFNLDKAPFKRFSIHFKPKRRQYFFFNRDWGQVFNYGMGLTVRDANLIYFSYKGNLIPINAQQKIASSTHDTGNNYTLYSLKRKIEHCVPYLQGKITGSVIQGNDNVQDDLSTRFWFTGWGDWSFVNIWFYPTLGWQYYHHSNNVFNSIVIQNTYSEDLMIRLELDSSIPINEIDWFYPLDQYYTDRTGHKNGGHFIPVYANYGTFKIRMFNDNTVYQNITALPYNATPNQVITYLRNYFKALFKNLYDSNNSWTTAQTNAVNTMIDDSLPLPTFYYYWHQVHAINENFINALPGHNLASEGIYPTYFLVEIDKSNPNNPTTPQISFSHYDFYLDFVNQFQNQILNDETFLQNSITATLQRYDPVTQQTLTENLNYPGQPNIRNLFPLKRKLFNGISSTGFTFGIRQFTRNSNSVNYYTEFYNNSNLPSNVPTLSEFLNSYDGTANAGLEIVDNQLELRDFQNNVLENNTYCEIVIEKQIYPRYYLIGRYGNIEDKVNFDRIFDANYSASNVRGYRYCYGDGDYKHKIYIISEEPYSMFFEYDMITEKFRRLASLPYDYIYNENGHYSLRFQYIEFFSKTIIQNNQKKNYVLFKNYILCMLYDIDLNEWRYINLQTYNSIFNYNLPTSVSYNLVQLHPVQVELIVNSQTYYLYYNEYVYDSIDIEFKYNNNQYRLVGLTRARFKYFINNTWYETQSMLPIFFILKFNVNNNSWTPTNEFDFKNRLWENVNSRNLFGYPNNPIYLYKVNYSLSDPFGNSIFYSGVRIGLYKNKKFYFVIGVTNLLMCLNPYQETSILSPENYTTFSNPMTRMYAKDNNFNTSIYFLQYLAGNTGQLQQNVNFALFIDSNNNFITVRYSDSRIFYYDTDLEVEEDLGVLLKDSNNNPQPIPTGARLIYNKEKDTFILLSISNSIVVYTIYTGKNLQGGGSEAVGFSDPKEPTSLVTKRYVDNLFKENILIPQDKMFGFLGSNTIGITFYQNRLIFKDSNNNILLELANTFFKRRINNMMMDVVASYDSNSPLIIRKLTQSEYNSLSSIDPRTLYIIV